MGIGSVNSILAAYQYEASIRAGRTQKTTASGTSFTESLQGAAKADTSNVDVYTKYLISKYGKVTIQSVGKDQNAISTFSNSVIENI